MDPNRAVEVRVGGKSYRLVASTDADTLRRLAALVDEKLEAIDSRHPNALLLAAIALAHDIERLNGDNHQLGRRSRAMLSTLLSRVDEALDHVDENGEPLSTPPMD